MKLSLQEDDGLEYEARIITRPKPSRITTEKRNKQPTHDHHSPEQSKKRGNVSIKSYQGHAFGGAGLESFYMNHEI